MTREEVYEEFKEEWEMFLEGAGIANPEIREDHIRNNEDLRKVVECNEYILNMLKQEPRGDAISRENAIIRISWDFPTLEISKVKESLDKLPSVNLMSCEDAISREDALMCLTGEIKEADTIETTIAKFVRRIRKLPPVNLQPCNDTISRQAVLALAKDECDTAIIPYRKFVKGVNALPSVNPQPCEDAISRHAALDEIRKCRFVVDAIEKIKVLPPVTPQQKWIPVSERLPKIADVYRVTRYYPNNVMNPNYLVDACFFDGSNTWYNDNRINHERDYANNVIAWQENPEPYKAEKE